MPRREQHDLGRTPDRNPTKLPEKPVEPGSGTHMFTRIDYRTQHFPKLLSSNPDLQHQLAELHSGGKTKREGLFTVNHLSQPYSFLELLDIKPADVSLADVLYKQRRTRYPSAVKRVDIARVRKENLIGACPLSAGYPEEYLKRTREFDERRRQEKPRLNRHIFEGDEERIWLFLNDQKFDQEALVIAFSDEEKRPNLSLGEPTGPVDTAVNTFLALHLTLGSKFQDTPKPIGSIAELTGVDPFALREGLIDLVAEATIQKLLNRKIITEDELPEFYQSTAGWMLENAQYLMGEKRTTSPAFIFPYPTNLFFHPLTEIEKRAIAIDFLPYLARTYAEFIANFHQLIREDEHFEPSALESGIKQLFTFTNQALAYYLQRALDTDITEVKDLKEVFERTKREWPEMARIIFAIYDNVQEMKPYFLHLLSYYRKHPQLLNRHLPPAYQERENASYLEWRQQVLDAGGKAPIKPTAIKFRHAVRKGEV